MKHPLSENLPPPSRSATGGFGLYVHWPFCTTKCPYCDFNSHVAGAFDENQWISAFSLEIQRMAQIAPGKALDTIFFGGGTPSLMPTNIVRSVVEAADGAWTFASNIEITLEANPGSADLERFEGYRRAGVNRLSLGIQSLRDADLRQLGRAHTASDAKRAIGLGRQVFPRLSCDLIYARQHQTAEAWESELSEVLSMEPDHLSLYQLTIENGTVFAKRLNQGKLPGLPDEALAVDLYEITSRLCGDVDLEQYEVSNWARQGHHCQHNLVYWRSGDFVGVGPGAHGRLTIDDRRYSTENVRDPKEWLAQVLNTSDSASRPCPISNAEWGMEYVLMGLRLSEGINLDRLQSITGRTLDPTRTTQMVGAGHIEFCGDMLRCTDSGRLLLDSVIAELLADF